MAFFLRRISNSAEAEDLTQEVLVKLLELPERDVRNPEAYIFSIAANLLRDRHRRLTVRAAWHGDAQNADLGIDRIDPLRQAESREQAVLVGKILSEMSQRAREILLLFRVERMKKRDIAESFGMSVSGVDKHLMKATAYLTKRMEDQA